MDEIAQNEYLIHLMEEYQNLVFSVCFRMTKDKASAEDLTQETFLSAYLKLKDFDRTNEKAWLCRIASNKCIDYLRSPGRRVELLESYEHVMSDKKVFVQSPEEIFIQEDIREQLHGACEQLKPPYDIVAKQYFYEEKSSEEIAQLQSKNVKTIQTQIYRARSMLKKYFKKGELDDG